MWLIRKFNNLKWRYKTFIGIELIVIVIALVVSVIYSIILGREMERQFLKRAESIVKGFSSNSIYGILLQDTNQLNQLIESFYEDGFTRYIAVYSSDGKVLVEKNLKILPDERKKLRDFKGDMDYTEFSIEVGHTLDLQAKVYREANLVGYVRFGFAKDEINAVISKAHFINFAFIAFAILLGLAFGYLVVVLFVKPVEKIRHAAELVAQGDINVAIADKSAEGNDEIGSLMKSFNKMVENIKNAIEEVTSQREVAEKLRVEADEARKRAQEQQRYLEDQFRKISDVVESVANGDLTKEAVAEKDDEVGMLVKKLNKMINDLRVLIKEIIDSSNAVANSTSQISSSAEEMSAAVQDQARQISEVVSAIEEMSKTIIENAHQAERVAELARENSSSATEGSKAVMSTIEQMHRLAEVVRNSAQSVQILGKSSTQIGEIIDVIEDIADQTNLLALNAAIEAARAGEQGRGFAVVADEVRKLAERTMKATKEISDMIKKIQNDTNEVVQIMKSGLEVAETGIRLADKANLALKQIVQNAEDVASLISEISRANKEQSRVSEDISKAVESISSIAEQTSAGVHQIAKAVDDLSKLTEKLRQIVMRFNIGETIDRGRYEKFARVGGNGL
ncbi:methyl-accepting chemotaxis protein [Candidatus Kryptonium thompsonii]|uniref:Methyl-accepting chemotaxis protein n=2 Tax=Candidatus Kryptonium thompsonii TaxID=1633631 RepID=A0A0P1P3Z6_9BACT|nr:methyl-accepting chemotaxis protein [Candidatus Kryptonium thompsoni]CUS77264.1 methyl-accepting chemotaxis protein [Candidatus Kryptonium thompsoni]CUS79002.1 methyl-accepting chemotaxis protein [Candidatus Kryptonium thompsoni]CUS90378.1 methyl-accepting chemotaxis protein [Candidatus Kryptonium thompsoni]CUS94820.1 methyl-accepting chemotaxis protein [Candidatus Kryptonium thompsoni]CUS99210.1 methyl-accepting chemotaxis protein [Candidatus Kryptonium thompsoni]